MINGVNVNHISPSFDYPLLIMSLYFSTTLTSVGLSILSQLLVSKAVAAFSRSAQNQRKLQFGSSAKHNG